MWAFEDQRSTTLSEVLVVVVVEAGCCCREKVGADGGGGGGGVLVSSRRPVDKLLLCWSCSAGCALMSTSDWASSTTANR